MRQSRILVVNLLPLVAAIGATTAAPSRAQPANTPRVSQFAPAADLLQQVDYFVGRASESLATADGFDLAKRSRTVKDANTLAALALVLAMHDGDFAEKPSMPAMLRAAQRLAASENDYAGAVGALAEIKTARAGQAAAAPAPGWEKSASLPVLMKQVPLIHAGLKRAIEPNRLKRLAAQSAGQSAALAAIAQASWVDDEYAKSPADLEKWRQYCGDMRDAAGAVNAAIHAADQPAVDAAMKRLQVSCDACHGAFRHP